MAAHPNLFFVSVLIVIQISLQACGDNSPGNQTQDSGESVPRPQARIAGGRTVNPGEVPYHFQIRHLDNYKCGAALVISEHGNQVILTAGQCVTEPTGSNMLPTSQLSVVGGRVRRNGVHAYEQFRAVTKVIRHQNWQKTYSFYYWDIALLHLDSPFELNQLVQPLPLVNRNAKPYGNVVISGWGYRDTEETDYSDQLQVAAIQPVPNDECKSLYEEEVTATLQSNHFCVGKHRNPTYQGACLGDAGSPAANVYNNTLFLVGLFNWGKPRCGNRFLPSIYTDLAKYRSWINEKAVPETRAAVISGWAGMGRDGRGGQLELLKMLGYDILDTDTQTTIIPHDVAPTAPATA